MSFYTQDKLIKSDLDFLISKLRKNKYSSERFPVFIFICGSNILCENSYIIKPRDELKKEGNRRYFILETIEQMSYRRSAIGIIAERLIEVFDEDSLTFEGILGEISDEVVLIVESEGTYCELGAFSFSNRLNDKLYVINNSVYEKADSFIRRGPITKLQTSTKSQVLHIPYDDIAVWENSPDIKTHFNEWSAKEVEYRPWENQEKSEINIKHFIYELMNIVEIFQPIIYEEIIEIYKYFKGSFNIKAGDNMQYNNINKIIEMLIKLQVFKRTKNKGYIRLNENLSCYDCMFKIDRNEMQRVRAHILSRVYKYDKYRLEENKYEAVGADG